MPQLKQVPMPGMDYVIYFVSLATITEPHSGATHQRHTVAPHKRATQ